MDKSRLRKKYLSSRQSLTRFQIQSRTQLISQRLIKRLPWSDCSVIHIYLPILDNHEIDTFPIIEYLRLNFESIQIAVPKVAPLNALKHYLLIDDTTLEPNMWGIPEPTNAVPIREDQIDLVVVPMIIFDRSGHRVGYGKGYYDRFLAKCRPDARKIGLCYFNPVKRIDTDPTDISMDVVVTPDGIWEFGDKPGINHS